MDNRSHLGKLYELFSRRDKRRFFFLNFLMLINAFLELLGVGAIPGLILLLTNPDNLGSVPVVGAQLLLWYKEDGQQMFFVAMAALFAVFLVKNLFAVFLYYLKGKFVRSIQVDLSQKLMSKYLKAPYSFHLSSNAAEMLRNVNNEVNQVVNNVIIQSLEFLLNIMMGLAILSLLFMAQPMLSTIALLVFGLVSIIFLRVTRKKIKQHGREAVKMRKKKSGIVLNSLNLLKEIKILGKEEYFSKIFFQAVKKEAFATLHKTVMSKIPRALLEILTIALMLSIILLMILQKRNMSEMTAILALFAVAASRLMPIANQISVSITNVRYSLPSVDPIYRDLTTIEDERVGETTDFGSLQQGVLSVRGLCFTYSGQQSPVFKDLNFDIALGSSVAFVGSSGAGKTTLVDILIGLLKPDSGDLLCNGKSILPYLRSWRSVVGYIPQRVEMVNESLLKNICLGVKPDEIDMGRVKEVVHLANLQETINLLPQGLDTLMGDKGTRLSGGQRQRVAIARALYQNPPILVMDEATSALDNITERFVVDAIDQMHGQRTIITIAHRLTTVKNCDLIYFMEGGKIVDHGSYDALIASNSNFRKLANTQEDAQSQTSEYLS